MLLRKGRLQKHGSELDAAFPFFGVKIYPSLGYFPSDPKLMDIFEMLFICERNTDILSRNASACATVILSMLAKLDVQYPNCLSAKSVYLLT